MKKNLFIILAAVFSFGFIVSAALSEFALPSYVYLIGQLYQAKGTARSYKKPITFLYSNKDTTCSLASAASSEAIYALKGITAIVYIDSRQKGDWEKTPNVVKKALASPRSGKYIPKCVITDSAVERVIFIVPYARGNKRAELLGQAVKKVEQY